MKHVEGAGADLPSASAIRRKLTLDPAVIAPEDVTDESSALASWYDAQPAVRRLWGIRTRCELRVIVVVEPTPDGDDSYPVWFGNARAWASELRSHVPCPVALELIQATRLHTVEIEAASVVIADLYWRDPTLG